MLNWKSQQFTKNLFPKKQTPMRNRRNQRGKKLTPFIAVQEIHLLKYIYFYIYRYYFFKFKHPKFKREREKKNQNKCLPHPPSRICWSLLVQNQKELFTERRTGGGWGCRGEENEVVTGGEEIVGFGPRRGEASLSSTAHSLRKMPHWEVSPVSPCPHVRHKGAAFLDPVSAPQQELGVCRCPSPHTLPWSSHASQPALDISSQRYTRSRGSALGVSAVPSWAPSHRSTTGSNSCWPFPSHRLLLLLTHFTPSLKSLSAQLNCVFTGA